MTEQSVVEWAELANAVVDVVVGPVVDGLAVAVRGTKNALAGSFGIGKIEAYQAENALIQ